MTAIDAQLYCIQANRTIETLIHLREIQGTELASALQQYDAAAMNLALHETKITLQQNQLEIIGIKEKAKHCADVEAAHHQEIARLRADITAIEKNTSRLTVNNLQEMYAIHDRSEHVSQLKLKLLASESDAKQAEQQRVDVAHLLIKYMPHEVSPAFPLDRTEINNNLGELHKQHKVYLEEHTQLAFQLDVERTMLNDQCSINDQKENAQ